MWPLERATLTSGAGPEYSMWERKRSPPRSAPVIFKVAPPTEMSTEPWSRLPAGTDLSMVCVPVGTDGPTATYAIEPPSATSRMRAAAAADAFGEMGMRETRSTSPMTMSRSGQRSARRYSRSAEMRLVLTRRATAPSRMRTAGQMRPRYREPGVSARNSNLLALAPDDEPGAEQDEEDGPHDVEPQPVEQAQVVEQEIDADDHQHHG